MSARSMLGKSLGLLGPAFVSVDAYSRVKDGESVPVAAGKALLTNAAFSLVPGGALGAAGVAVAGMAIQAGPAIRDGVQRKAHQFDKNRQNFGERNFAQTEGQMGMMDNSYDRMINARRNHVRNVANHARNIKRVY